MRGKIFSSTLKSRITRWGRRLLARYCCWCWLHLAFAHNMMPPLCFSGEASRCCRSMARNGYCNKGKELHQNRACWTISQRICHDSVETGGCRNEGGATGHRCHQYSSVMLAPWGTRWRNCAWTQGSAMNTVSHTSWSTQRPGIREISWIHCFRYKASQMFIWIGIITQGKRGEVAFVFLLRTLGEGIKQQKTWYALLTLNSYV